MNCLHPRRKTIVDAITGESRVITFPCGECINCLHDFQEMWSIRLSETSKHYKRLIYDTITFRPAAVRTKIDYTRPTKDGRLYGTNEKYLQWKVNSMTRKYSTFHRFYPRISKESWEMLKRSKFKVYEIDKAEIQNWIKRGREQYKRDHNGQRLDISYFITEEYCPTTGRPHCHLLMFGISQADYYQYFGSVARRDYGFTCPTFIMYSPDHRKDVNCITKYLSKYICKGDFELALVKDGILPKSWRLMSKGIGQGLLKHPKYDVFKSEDMQYYKQFSLPSQQVYLKTLEDLRKGGASEEDIHKYIEDYESKKSQVDCELAFYKCDAVDNLSEDDVENLYCYYDEGGYPHKLPAYYKQKLFGGTNNEKNILQSKIQSVLEQSARLHDNKVIQKEALALGVVIPDDWCTRDSSTWELSPSTLFMVLNNHTVRQRNQAEIVAERRKTRLKNFYNRPLCKVDEHNYTIKI